MRRVAPRRTCAGRAARYQRYAIALLCIVALAGYLLSRPTPSSSLPAAISIVTEQPALPAYSSSVEDAIDEDDAAAAISDFAKLALPPTAFARFDLAKAPRIFCMVPTQLYAKKTFYTILDLWGKWCDEIVFTVDPKHDGYSEPGQEHLQPEEEVEVITSHDGQVRGKIVYLNKLVRRKGNDCWAGGGAKGHTPCRHIWEKVWRSWVYVSDHYGQSFDFYFKVDDDTFFFVPVMREVLMERAWTAHEHHYFGHHTYPTDQDRGLINGALVGFSRLTLNTLVNDVYKTMPKEYGDRRNFRRGTCCDRDGATEEVSTTRCLNSGANFSGGVVKPEALYDSRILPRRPHVLLWMPRDMLTFSRRDNSSSWFYRNAPRDVGTLLDCCSYRPVAFHFMRSQENLHRVYQLIADPDGEGELESVVRDKVPQWEQQQSGGGDGREHKEMCSVFDALWVVPSTCAKEARYWAKVKEVWHARHPSWYAASLPAP